MVAAVGLIGKCIHSYYLDKDVSQVEYRNFHETEEYIYPSITLCLKEPLSPWKFWVERFGSEIVKDLNDPGEKSCIDNWKCEKWAVIRNTMEIFYRERLSMIPTFN